MTRFDTLADILPADAREDRRITFIDGESDQRVLSFRRLRQRAVGSLGALQRRGVRPGDAVIVCLADNERFVEMFWACVLGGIVPVPLSAGGTDEHGRKLGKVFGQLRTGSRRAWIGIDAPALDRLAGFAASQPDAFGAGFDAAALHAHALIPAALDSTGEPGRPRPGRPDDLAYVQYSSGSTGAPKGVLLTHRNLSANIASIAEAAAYTDRDSVLSWMPLSHDMGLIGFHLSLLACGAEHAFLRTELFARRPLLWLDEAGRRRATVLCSPNFGYQHYLRQYAAKPPARLDLSSVRLVYDGAEPISAALCRRFAATLAPHGLKPNVLLTVYGLAEASLAVSFPRLGAPLDTVWLDRTRLQVGEPVQATAPGAAQATEFVKLGTPLAGTEVGIVDDAGAPLGPGRVGHIRIRGENVTQGYFGGTGVEAQAEAPARTADGWLDTGDLGLFDGGQLVVTGRAKDVVFVNGQNVYPHDIERIAEDVPGIETNRVAAAGVRRADGDGEELALFVLHRGAPADFAPTALELRRVVNRQTGFEVAHVVPVGRIPKTTSGKLQRHALAAAFERGDFDAARAVLAPLLAADAAAGAAGADGAPVDAAASTLRRLQDICARVVPDRRITAETHLMESNLNSLSLARIHEAIDREFPDRLEVTDLFDYPTLARLAAFLDAKPT